LFGMTMDKDTIPTFEYIIKKLNDYNLAYVHLSEPFTDVLKFLLLYRKLLNISVLCIMVP
jgi:hypothetical protein